MSEPSQWLRAELDEIKQELRGVHDQTKATNGRVTTLEDRSVRVDLILHGDDRMHTRGLVADALDAARMVREWQSVKRAGMWVAATFGAATIALGGNLAYYVLTT